MADESWEWNAMGYKIFYAFTFFFKAVMTLASVAGRVGLGWRLRDIVMWRSCVGYQGLFSYI